MKTHINLIRAIGSEFAARKLKFILLAFGIFALIALIGALWLATLNAWWWLLAIPVIGITLLGLLISIAANIIIKVLRPKLTKSQAVSVKEFVDKLERVADTIQTPLFIIVFRVLGDIIRPNTKTFIQTAAEDSTALHKDFLTLQRKFKL